MNNLMKYSFAVLFVLSSTVYNGFSQQTDRFFYAPTRLKPTKEINKPKTEAEVKEWADKNEAEINASIANDKKSLDEQYRKKRRRRYRSYHNWNYGVGYSSRYGWGYGVNNRYPYQSRYSYRNHNNWRNYDGFRGYYPYSRRRVVYDDFCSPFQTRGVYDNCSRNRNITRVGFSNDRVFVGHSWNSNW